jgi:hypothetical protein
VTAENDLDQSSGTCCVVITGQARAAVQPGPGGFDVSHAEDSPTLALAALIVDV